MSSTLSRVRNNDARSAGMRGRDAVAAVTGDDRGHAVPTRRRQGRIPQHLRVVVRVDVDEPGRHDAPGRIDLASRRTVADLDDPTVGDADIGRGPRAARCRR